MSHVGSVTQWIAQAKEGDEVALGRIHQRYWPTLVERARRKLKGAPLRGADEEDVAQNAFVGFHRTLHSGRVPRLENRHDLLALLTHIVACKAVNEIKHALAKRRGEGQIQNMSLDQILAEEGDETPLQKAILKDCYDFYVRSLPEQLRRFAVLHLAGLSNHQIAAQMECSQRTVERKTALLKSRWRALAESVNQDVTSLLSASP